MWVQCNAHHIYARVELDIFSSQHWCGIFTWKWWLLDLALKNQSHSYKKLNKNKMKAHRKTIILKIKEDYFSGWRKALVHRACVLRLFILLLGGVESILCRKNESVDGYDEWRYSRKQNEQKQTKCRRFFKSTSFANITWIASCGCCMFTVKSIRFCFNNSNEIQTKCCFCFFAFISQLTVFATRL